MKLDLSKIEDDEKFRQLILFICRRSEGDPPFGATKLNKLLFYCDFLAYLKFGRPLTGHRYQKLPHGPAPRAIVPVLRQMEQEHLTATAERDYLNRKQKRTFALKDADLSTFTANEIAMVTDMIQECWGKSATEMSQMTHRFRGWRLAEEGEDIPYEVATVKFEKLTGRDMALTPEERSELMALVGEGHSGNAN